MKKKHERNPRTHFAQVPLEVVKKIAEADVSKDEETGTDNIVKPVSGKTATTRVRTPSRDRKRR